MRKGHRSATQEQDGLLPPSRHARSLQHTVFASTFRTILDNVRTPVDDPSSTTASYTASLRHRIGTCISLEVDQVSTQGDLAGSDRSHTRTKTQGCVLSFPRERQFPFARAIRVFCSERQARIMAFHNTLAEKACKQMPPQPFAFHCCPPDPKLGERRALETDELPNQHHAVWPQPMLSTLRNPTFFHAERTGNPRSLDRRMHSRGERYGKALSFSAFFRRALG